MAKSADGVISEHEPVKIVHAAKRKWVGGAAGRSHMLLCDDQGGVWGCGNNVVGQLGLVSVCAAVTRL